MLELAFLTLLFAAPATLNIEKDEAVLRQGDREVRVPVRLDAQPVQDPDYPDAREADSVAFVSGCLVVHRDVRTLGDFCHTPRPRAVELYTIDGKVERPDPALGASVGASSDGSFEVLFLEEEGRTYGWTIARPDCRFESHELSDVIAGDDWWRIGEEWSGGVLRVFFVEGSAACGRAVDAARGRPSRKFLGSENVPVVSWTECVKTLEIRQDGAKVVPTRLQSLPD